MTSARKVVKGVTLAAAAIAGGSVVEPSATVHADAYDGDNFFTDEVDVGNGINGGDLAVVWQGFLCVRGYYSAPSIDASFGPVSRNAALGFNQNEAASNNAYVDYETKKWVEDNGVWNNSQTRVRVFGNGKWEMHDYGDTWKLAGWCTNGSPGAVFGYISQSGGGCEDISTDYSILLWNDCA